MIAATPQQVQKTLSASFNLCVGTAVADYVLQQLAAAPVPSSGKGKSIDVMGTDARNGMPIRTAISVDILLDALQAELIQ